MRKFGGAFVASSDRVRDQVVGEMRVLRQQAAVQVRADHAALHRALGPVRAVVAVAQQNLARRSRVGAEVGAAAVVLEPDERAGGEMQRLARLDDDVADEALLARLRGHVEQADAVEPLAVGRLVVVAEQLVAAADREHLGAVLDRRLQMLLLVLAQVVVDQRLFAVLAAAEEEDIDVLHLVAGRAALKLDDARLEPMPLRAAQEREDVAAVAVDVHQVWVQPADRELHVSQYGCAHPRRTSSARRSSIAVYVHSMCAVSPSFVVLISMSSALPGSVCGSSARTPAYLSRTARSCARSPAGMTVTAWSLSISKSTSQIQLTSVPSAFRSLRPMTKFLPFASLTAVRTVSLKPAGFLLSTRTRWRPRKSILSCRPKAALNVRRRSAM